MKINSVNLFYLIIDKVNGSFEKLTKIALIPSNESKEIIKKYEELWSKTRNLSRLITKNSDDYDEKMYKNKSKSEAIDLMQIIDLTEKMDYYN